MSVSVLSLSLFFFRDKFKKFLKATLLCLRISKVFLIFAADCSLEVPLIPARDLSLRYSSSGFRGGQGYGCPDRRRGGYPAKMTEGRGASGL